MLVERRRKALFVSGLVIGGLVMFALGAWSAKVFLARDRAFAGSAGSKNARGPLMTEGFDFKALRDANNEWRGPDIGVKIDLTRLQTQDGRTLASMVGKRPIMIVGLHPECGMCKIATDQFSHLRKKLATMDVNYYLVSFSSSETSAPNFFEFTDSLKVGAPGFLWNAEAGAPPESLFMMTTPTHLLLNSDGTVIRVWPGSNQDLPVRQRMTRQIVADTFVALDTLNAIADKTSDTHSTAKLR